MAEVLLHGMSSRFCFLPGPDFSSPCSTSKSGAQPHSVTSIPRAPFLLVILPGGYALLLSPAWPRSTKYSVLGPRDESAALIQNQNQGLPAVEKSFLGSKTHLSCLSSFLWLENSREEGVGSRLGGEATSRRQQGRRGDRAGAVPETLGCPWPGRGDEAVK